MRFRERRDPTSPPSSTNPGPDPSDAAAVGKNASNTTDALAVFEERPSVEMAVLALASAASGTLGRASLDWESYSVMYDSIARALKREGHAHANEARKAADWLLDSSGAGRMSDRALLSMLSSLVGRWGLAEAKKYGLDRTSAELEFATRLVCATVLRDPLTGRPRMRRVEEIQPGEALSLAEAIAPATKRHRPSRSEGRVGAGFRFSARRAIALCGGLGTGLVPFNIVKIRTPLDVR